MTVIIDEALRNKRITLTSQKQRGIQSLQAPSRKLIDAHINGITVPATKCATSNRFRLYENFCSAVGVPTFPILGDVVFLHLHDINGSATGTAYDSHTSALNTLRKEILPIWSNQPGCETASGSVTLNPAVKEFCSLARAAALEKKLDRLKREEEYEKKRMGGGGSAARRGAKSPGSARKSTTTVEASTSASTPGGSRKRGLGSSPGVSQLETPSKATPSRTSRRTAGAAGAAAVTETTTPSTLNKRRKLDVPLPPPTPTSTTTRRTIKLAVKAPSTPSESSSTTATTPRRAASRASRSTLPPSPAVATTTNGNSRTTRRNNKLAEEAEEEGEIDMAVDVDNEDVESGNIVEEEVKEEEIGMFGRIVKYFGFGSQ